MTSTSTSLQICRTFRAPRDRVFAAWTERAQLERWMCRDVPTQQARYTELDVRAGGSYLIEILMPDGVAYHGRGIFQEVLPPEKLVFTWAWTRTPPDPAIPLQKEDSVVTVLLLDRGAETEMIFTHELLDNDTVRAEHERGWEGCFQVLAEALRPDA